MRNTKLQALILLMLFAFLSMQSEAQQVFELNSRHSSLIVKGTSSLHDWEMEATEFNTNTTLQVTNEKITEIQGISFSAPVKDLSSDKWIMDKNAHEALKEDEYPTIKFSLKSEKDIKVLAKEVTIPGMLTIAGNTNYISLSCTYEFISPQQLNVNGTTLMKMSDFGIDPPTAMMGTLKTGDDITIEFKLEFKVDTKSSAEVLQ
ncbi:MAG: YceI family protein [Prolixibacteraceae bacterium]|jgi:polyisoprenoid-binding protein YceI|nr:YceI family protein [Prolixibacteraceae bacterium]